MPLDDIAIDEHRMAAFKGFWHTRFLIDDAEVIGRGHINPEAVFLEISSIGIAAGALWALEERHGDRRRKHGQDEGNNEKQGSETQSRQKFEHEIGRAS